MAKGRIVAGSCLVFGILAIVGGIVANILLNDAATTAIQDASITKTFSEAKAEDYSKWIGETVDEDAPPLYYNYYLFHNTNPEGPYPEFVPVGPFTYQARKHKYDVVFNEEGSLVTFKERTTVTFDAAASGTVPEGVTMYKVNTDETTGCPTGQTWLPPGAPGTAVTTHTAGDKLSEWTLITGVYSTGLLLFKSIADAGLSEVNGVGVQFGLPIALGGAQKLYAAAAGVPNGHPLYQVVNTSESLTRNLASILLSTNPAAVGALNGGFPGYTYPNFGSYVEATTSRTPSFFNFEAEHLETLLFHPVWGLGGTLKFDAASYIAAGSVHPGLQPSALGVDGQPMVAAIARLAQIIGTLAAPLLGPELSAHHGFEWAKYFGGGNPAHCQDTTIAFNPATPCFLSLFAGWVTDRAGPYSGFEASFGMDVGLTNWLSRTQSDVTSPTAAPRIWSTRPAKDFLRTNNDKADAIAEHGETACATMTSSVDTIRHIALPSASGKLPSMAFQDDQKLEDDDPIHGAPAKWTIFTGKKDLAALNDASKYLDLSALPSRKSAAGNLLSEWWYCNDDIPIEGRYLKQWPPGEADTLGFKDGVAGDKDFKPVVFSDAIWRPVTFLPTEENPKHHGIKTRRFALDATQLDPNPTYDQYVKGVGNFTCFSQFGASYDSLGLPIAVTRPYFEDADILGKLFLPGIIKDQTAPGQLDAAKHETYLDIEPRTGAVFAVRERLQSNLIFPIPRNATTGACLDPRASMCAFLAPVYYLERSVDISEALAKKFKSDFEDNIALKDMVWGGIGVGGVALVLFSSVAFLVFCLRGRQPKTTTVNW